MKRKQIELGDVLFLKGFLESGKSVGRYYDSGDFTYIMSYSNVCAKIRRVAKALYERYADEIGRDFPKNLYVSHVVARRGITLHMIGRYLKDSENKEPFVVPPPSSAIKEKEVFKLSQNYKGASGYEVSVDVLLELDYTTGFAKLRTYKNSREFIFERRGDFQIWVILADLIKKAVELAESSAIMEVEYEEVPF